MEGDSLQIPAGYPLVGTHVQYHMLAWAQTHTRTCNKYIFFKKNHTTTSCAEYMKFIFKNRGLEIKVSGWRARLVFFVSLGLRLRTTQPRVNGARVISAVGEVEAGSLVQGYL